ncbi:MAG: type III polyketide synthase [Bacteroidota bacterium]|nr:type III polyketide synthase [Bacteroidota bacterium]MDP4218388.1 type III polyketide synthase [Bacteroidota bacterium]MDP4256673.1 type III polyketide synthase [Bacteroidota bacterium]
MHSDANMVSKIISIGTATPAYMHSQDEILQFMQRIYSLNTEGRRKLRYLYHQSSIKTRYSVVSDYTRPAAEWEFYPATENLEPFPSLEERMRWYDRHAAPLSVKAILSCLDGKADPKEITHLITVSCTGMSAPGLDLQIVDLMDLSPGIFRTSVNFMGCYAAIHALKLANSICRSEPGARVLIVCTELCTLHFQREPTEENMTSSLLFGDGSAAALIIADAEDHPEKGLRLESFYSEVIAKGKKDMAWTLSSTGFRMTLSNYIPDLIGEDLALLVNRALKKNGMRLEDITHWCVHPGGKRVLEAISKSLHFTNGHLDDSYSILKEYGNMSSPTLLFVLQRILYRLDFRRANALLGVAFGPGLTMETFIATTAGD